MTDSVRAGECNGCIRAKYAALRFEQERAYYGRFEDLKGRTQEREMWAEAESLEQNCPIHKGNSHD
jgi:hypothetical protein